MLAGIALLGVGAYMIHRKGEKHLAFVQAVLDRRRTIAQTGINTPSPSDKEEEAYTEDSELASADGTSGGFDEFEAP